MLFAQKVDTCSQYNVVNLYWHLRQSQNIKWEFPLTRYNRPPRDESVGRVRVANLEAVQDQPLLRELLVHFWPGKTHEILHASLVKADEEKITSEMVVLDSVWVRKWKCRPDGHRRMNFASEVASTTSGTPSQPIRPDYSNQAESANLGLPTAVNDDRDAESWDASGALLKGLGFEKVRELLAS